MLKSRRMLVPLFHRQLMRAWKRKSINQVRLLTLPVQLDRERRIHYFFFNQAIDSSKATNKLNSSPESLESFRAFPLLKLNISNIGSLTDKELNNFRVLSSRNAPDDDYEICYINI